MRSFALIALLAGLVAAQDPAAPAPAGAATHTVVVGGAAPPADATSSPTPRLFFQPEFVNAAVGDTVTFVFMQSNHSLTQSTFANPCVKKDGGIDSGFLANPQGDAGVTFSMQVPSADPLWFYCKQRTGTHCGKAMVFSVNPKPGVAEGSHTMFKQMAIQQNGTALQEAQIQAAPAAAAPSTVTIAAQPAVATDAAAAAATIATGQGTTPGGQACTCACLCGVGSFPQNVAIGNFGGIPGIMSA